MSDVTTDLSGRVFQLERAVARLSDEVAVLRALVDPDDTRAVEEMRRNPVTNAQLREWRDIQSSPTGLATNPKKNPGSCRCRISAGDESFGRRSPTSAVTTAIHVRS